MPLCSSCSAPLEPNTFRCQYCNVRNKMDLQDNLVFIKKDNTFHCCPICKKILVTISIKAELESIEIERCNTCFGLFFNHGEIKKILDSSVKNISINRKLIDNLNKDRSQDNTNFSYIDCPVCKKKMNRRLFGYKSGVIINHCIDDGIWLNNGDLTHLMEWKKAGGELLDEIDKEKIYKKREKERQLSFKKSLENQIIIQETTPNEQFEFDTDFFYKIFDSIAAFIRFIFGKH